jgi:hypothetical protein
MPALLWIVLGGAALWFLLRGSGGGGGPEGLRRPSCEEAARAVQAYGEQRLAVKTDVVRLLKAFGDQSVDLGSLRADVGAIREDADLLDYVYDLPTVAGLLRRLAAMAETAPPPPLPDMLVKIETPKLKF